MEALAITPSPELIGVGEAMWTFATGDGSELRRGATYSAMLAGAESNVAIGAAALGASAGFAGRVGGDPFGAAILDRLGEFGVDCSRVVVDPERPTGLMFKGARSGESVEVSYRRAGSAGSALAPGDLDEDHLRGARIIHASGVNPALSSSCGEAVGRALDLAARGDGLASFDFNLRPQLWEGDPAGPILDLARRSEVCFASAEEAAAITGESDPAAAAAAIAALGPRIVCVKLGAEGAVALCDRVLMTVPPRSVEVLDTVGAGDAFAAGFLVANILRGRSPQEALRVAAWCGAEVAASREDAVRLPPLEEIEKRIGG